MSNSFDAATMPRLKKSEFTFLIGSMKKRIAKAPDQPTSPLRCQDRHFRSAVESTVGCGVESGIRKKKETYGRGNGTVGRPPHNREGVGNLFRKARLAIAQSFRSSNRHGTQRDSPKKIPDPFTHVRSIKKSPNGAAPIRCGSSTELCLTVLMRRPCHD